MDRKKRTIQKTYIIIWSLILMIGGFATASLIFPVSEPAAQTNLVLPETPRSFSDLAKRASPSVVNISTVKVIKGGGRIPMPFGPNDPFREFFDRFFRDQIPRDYRQRSLGTGFIIDEEGYILTNNHVVEKADKISVSLSDDREFDAKGGGLDV